MIIEKTSLLAGAFQHGDRCRRRQDRLHRAGISWGNGYCERFNGKLRGEWLNGGIFYTLKEAPIVIDWRRHCNTMRRHSLLEYRPPASKHSSALHQRS